MTQFDAILGNLDETLAQRDATPPRPRLTACVARDLAALAGASPVVDLPSIMRARDFIRRINEHYEGKA